MKGHAEQTEAVEGSRAARATTCTKRSAIAGRGWCGSIGSEREKSRPCLAALFLAVVIPVVPACLDFRAKHGAFKDSQLKRFQVIGVSANIAACYGGCLRGGALMPIDRLLKSRGVAPEDAERLRRAFNLALNGLQLVDRNDPICEIVADRVIAVGLNGTRDPKEIAELTISQLGP